jgi:dUTPase
MLFTFHRTTKYAYSPIENKEGSLGFDIKIPYDYLIPKKSGITVQLDLTFSFSENCYAIIAPTSTFSRDYFLSVLNG